ncbi:MAG: gliding motility lipoprotein GldH [Paludibacter sp.]|nr:gliding motility lipoprotein GldH [Paludibacter sp.]
MTKILNSFFIIILLSTFCFVACTNNDIFFKYQKIPSEGWNKNNVLAFDFTIQQSSVPYNIYVNIRNTSEYPYQNFWLFIKKSVAASDSIYVVVQTDTVECYLADDRGKWLGRGAGAIYEMPLLIEKNIQLEQKKYRYELIQGMRNDILQGISDIGLRVEKAE